MKMEDLHMISVDITNTFYLSVIGAHGGKEQNDPVGTQETT